MGNSLGGLFSTQKEQDIQALRKARTEYRDYLTRIETNVKTDVTNKVLSPESGKSVLSVLSNSSKWLEKNPNATIIEVFANRDTATVEITRILSTDKPKREFLNQLTALPAILAKAVDTKVITDADKKAILVIKDTEQKWYDKNQANATTIDFKLEEQKLLDTIKVKLNNPKKYDYIVDKLKPVKTIPTSNVESASQQELKKLEDKKSNEISISKGVNTIIETAIKTFLVLVIVSICLFSGMLASNFAIGRPSAYRIFYFIYGAIPLYVPIVLLYSLVQRITKGPLDVYAMLPFQTLPAETQMGRFFQLPFLWTPDETAIQKAKEFQRQLQAITV